MRILSPRTLTLVAVTVFVPALALTPPATAQSGGYQDLVDLFTDWRAFERPTFVDGVPDYTADAMARQQEEVETVEPWMEAALAAVSGQFTPAEPGEIRNFFQEVIYRDPDAFRPHMHHWIELARMREDPHSSPIRRVPGLYNLWDNRSEGLATGVEEWFMHLGLLADNSPRARELVWIMAAQRAARATSGLMLHGREFDMEQAVDYASKWTPRGWLPDGDLVRFDSSMKSADLAIGEADERA